MHEMCKLANKSLYIQNSERIVCYISISGRETFLLGVLLLGESTANLTVCLNSLWLIG